MMQNKKEKEQWNMFLMNTFVNFFLKCLPLFCLPGTRTVLNSVCYPAVQRKKETAKRVFNPTNNHKSLNSLRDFPFNTVFLTHLQ